MFLVTTHSKILRKESKMSKKYTGRLGGANGYVEVIIRSKDVARKLYFELGYREEFNWHYHFGLWKTKEESEICDPRPLEEGENWVIEFAPLYTRTHIIPSKSMMTLAMSSVVDICKKFGIDCRNSKDIIKQATTLR